MGTFTRGYARTLLIGCAISSMFNLAAEAAGDGVIVLVRDVKPQAFGRPALQPDPNPTTVNANPSNRIHPMSGGMELDDGDIAGINTGASVRHSVINHTVNSSVLGNQNGVPGMTNVSHGGGGTGGIANTVNRSISAGMGALNAIGNRGQ